MPVRCMAYRLFGSVSALVEPRSFRGLPVLVHVVSQRARVLRLRRAGLPLAITRQAVLPSRLGRRSATLVYPFSKLNSPAHRCPCLRFDCNLTATIARLRVKMEFALSFLVRLFHPLQHAGLSRRTPKQDSNRGPSG